VTQAATRHFECEPKRAEKSGGRSDWWDFSVASSRARDEAVKRFFEMTGQTASVNIPETRAVMKQCKGRYYFNEQDHKSPTSR
jgi:hypothetical protein